MSKLVLGTAQLGMDYGISNKQGKTELEEARKIINLCRANQISMFDTAPVYGDSEVILGSLLEDFPQAQVISKITQLDSVGKNLKQTLNFLKRDSIYALLFHKPQDLVTTDAENIVNQVLSLKEEGYVKKIGISVYKQEEIKWVIDRFPMDIIQFPINILDQRLLANGYLSYLKDRGFELHARSVFLQGLLLMSLDAIPAYFSSIMPLLTNFRAYLIEKNLTPIEAALAFVSNIPEIDRIICGVNNHKQLEDIIAACSMQVDAKQFQSFAIQDESIVNPSRWVVL